MNGSTNTPRGTEPRYGRAQRYLSRVERLESELDYKRLHLRSVRGLTSRGMVSGYGGGVPADRTGGAAMRAQELTKEIEGLQERLIRARSDVRRTVSRLPNPGTRCLMEMRYLSHMKWEDISEALDVSPRTALRRHQRALQTVEALLEERNEKE